MNNIVGNTTTVLTLDAGGTNLVFSALTGGELSAGPIYRSSIPDSAENTLVAITEGFREIISLCRKKPSAISFAFPGPADYKRGIIGTLPNLPGFTQPFPLGPYLEEEFSIPVFINNDGNLFTLGEWHRGFLYETNRLLASGGSRRRYENLLGITIGTGFGAGVVLNGTMIIGDNSLGGELWCTENSVLDGYCSEATVGRKYIGHLYNNFSGTPDNPLLEPDEIYTIALSRNHEGREAACRAFACLGESAGNAVANALSLIDGLVVIGGGISAAFDIFGDSFMKVLNSSLHHRNGKEVRRLQFNMYNLEDIEERELFFQSSEKETEAYDLEFRSAVGLSRLGTNAAVALGAYIFAVEKLK